MMNSTINNGFCFRPEIGADAGAAPAAAPAKAKKAAKKAAKKPAKGSNTGLGQNMLDSLQALAKGHELTHEEIAAKTTRKKGNRLRELTELGLIRTHKYEGDRGNKFCITPAGKKALEKVKK